VLGFLSVSTHPETRILRPWIRFNPVLGFLSVSTVERLSDTEQTVLFQSRAGFSECLDPMTTLDRFATTSFNPVLGFLSVSTTNGSEIEGSQVFQSRAGFSECLDVMKTVETVTVTVSIPCWVF